MIVVLVANTITGFVTEYRAVRAMESLRELTTTMAEVERDNRRDEIDAAELVPGDVVGVEAGERVPADVRLIEASDLTVEESALTGESAPVEKSPEPVGKDAGVPDRSSMLFMGTTAQTGRGRGVVVAIGQSTAVGRVADLADEAQGGKAPLQLGLERLGRTLAVGVVAVAAALAVVGTLQGLEASEVLEISIALAVAVVPEGLPAVATLTLAVGMRRMAARDALVRNLPVVETLGSTTVIASDKTGTLTSNRMTVVDVRTADGVDEDDLWRTAVLCNDADVGPDGDPVGDPTEVALLEAAGQRGLEWRPLREDAEREAELPFSPETKRMAVVVDGVMHVKGAPDVMLEPGSALRAAADDMAGRALRTLAIARRPDGMPPDLSVDRIDSSGEERGPSGKDLFDNLELLGVVGMEDPPREEAVEMVRAGRRAGIRVVMITGDRAETAGAIAERLGMRGDKVVTGEEIAAAPEDEASRLVEKSDVFARISPEQKLQIVRSMQDAGEIIAVTGDGVNDAPALRQADVGVAMGQSGTDVAREASDIILTNDNIVTIREAVAEGRRIFANIRRFGQFLFSWHLAEVTLVTAALTLGLPAPLGALMILWNNLIIDVLPSFALALEPSRAQVMYEPPRDPSEPVISRPVLHRIVIQAALVAGVGLLAYGIARGPLELQGSSMRSVVFVTITAAQLLAVFNARTDRGSGFPGATRNPWLWLALGVCIALETAAFLVVPLREVLGLAIPPGSGWLMAAALAPLPLVLTQARRIMAARSSHKSTSPRVADTLT